MVAERAPKGWRLVLVAVLAVSLAAAAAPTLRDMVRPRPFNVILLTVESFRADAVSPELTPRLWAALRDGARFTNHRAVSAWTVPNIVAVLEGVSPFEQGIHTRGNYLPASWPLPLKALAAAGWRVAALQAFANMDVYRNLGLEVEAGANPIAWLARQAAANRPFSLWYHYLDTHLPYAPPPPFLPDWRALLPAGDAAAVERMGAVMTLPAIPTGTVSFQASDRPAIQALHEGAVRAFDAWFGDFHDFLKASGLSRSTLLVITADHGDEHLDHGQLGHASTNRNGHLHEELVHVPLMLWLPEDYRPPDGQNWRGRTVTAANDHLDIMPTVLKVLGRTFPQPVPGHDLLTLGPEGHHWSAVTSKAGFADPDPDHITEFVAARLEGSWKLHLRRVSGHDEPPTLFNLASDPGELIDVAAQHPDIVHRLQEALDRELVTMRPPSAGDPDTGAADAVAEYPRWIFPAASVALTSGDVAGGFSLRWTGIPTGRYVIQYRAGEGAREIAGSLEVTGTVKEFGAFDRHYWDTFILPYHSVRMRVGVKGREETWSEWVTLIALP